VVDLGFTPDASFFLAAAEVKQQLRIWRAQEFPMVGMA
jgi:hypothetical protein